jgi:hypothetical protein
MLWKLKSTRDKVKLLECDRMVSWDSGIWAESQVIASVQTLEDLGQSFLSRMRLWGCSEFVLFKGRAKINAWSELG